MLTLFISTYNEYVIIGLLKDGKEISLINRTSLKGHNTLIVPSIEEILKNNNLTVHDLNNIIVVNGPGSFTGIRLGITVAKTLAYTLNISIKTISSIEAIACSISDKDKIITINDSKGKYIGKFINHELVDLIYLKETEAIKYLDDNNLPIFSEFKFDLEAIYNYSLNLQSVPAHAVKALYIKEIEALHGR